jgi:asparagine synthase (glutamine-hydrolysing)
MCGIVGVVDIVAGRVSPRVLAAMRDVMMRRGPDGEGQYVDGAIGMAMRRLAIIDLEGGGQPFFARDGDVVAFQNGEIYNYRALRWDLEARGYRFVSESDTEVLAHGFAEWGAAGLLERLDGMYAIAILDRARRELHLARDRFGEKPLYYAHAEGRFAYASSLLALAALDWVSDDVDGESLDRYLALHYVPGEATILKGIRRVLPGERLVVPIDDPRPTRHRYYMLRLGETRRVTDRELAGLLEDAVASRLVADVPVGIFLSGGLDSSVMAAIAARREPRIATFSVGFDAASHDESPYAETVARAIGSRHYQFRFDEDSFRALLPAVAAALDEPVGDQAQLPLYWLCREARRHVTVALSGEGADEIFAGYSYYRRHATARSWRERLAARWRRPAAMPEGPGRLIDNPTPETPSGFPLLTDAAGRARLTGASRAEFAAWEASLMAWVDRAADGLQRATAADLATWLPDDLLVKFDRVSMAHSLEGRAPYLAPRVVEAGLSLPPAQRMNGATSKVALRRVASRWLPPEILTRPKQGFVLPMARWLAQWFEAQGSVREYFLERAVPGLNMAEVARLAQHDLSEGVRRERLLFALVLLVEWYRAFKAKQRELASEYRQAAARANPEVTTHRPQAAMAAAPAD